MMIRTYKTGISREQASLLPPCVDDYVGRNNMVRAIDCYVDTLDLTKLGFVLAGSDGGPGQPPYHPGDLLKLYLYGYLQRIRSSRALEREAARNLEVIWLIGGLMPRYRTIAGFRKDNWAALKAVNREFVLLARKLDLIGGEVVAIDGAFFDGNASKGSIKTRRKIEAHLAALDEEIEAYGAAVEANDATEAVQAAERRDGEGEDIAQKMAALLAKRGRVQADLARRDESGDTQLSRTDPDARILSKRGQVVAGYNVQIAVDDKYKLIVASEVVNDGNDTGQLYPMAKAAKEELGVATLTALADTGYYNGRALKACEEDAIVAYVPQAKRTARLEAQERISHEAFVYDREADVYRCPADQVLRPDRWPARSIPAAAHQRSGMSAKRKADCDACTRCARAVSRPRRQRAPSPRWEHEDVAPERASPERMKDARTQMRRRAELAEHPFGIYLDAGPGTPPLPGPRLQ